MRFNIFIIMTVIFIGNIFAVNKNAGTSGFNFLKLNVSARAAAMGNAFTAVADDANAVFFNPAGLINLDKRELQTSYMKYIDNSQLGSLAFADLDKHINYAVFLQYFYSGEINKTLANPDGSYAGTNGIFYTSNIVFGGAFAYKFNEQFILGVSSKYLIETLDEKSASALIADIGILHNSPNPKIILAVTVKNLGKQLSYFTDDNYEENLPVTVIGGAKYKFDSSMIFTLDGYLPVDEDFSVRFGAEKIFNPYFTFRMGYDTRGRKWDVSDEFLSVLGGVSFGFGTKWRKLIIDCSFVSYGDLGIQNQISLGYYF